MATFLLLLFLLLLMFLPIVTWLWFPQLWLVLLQQLPTLLQLLAVVGHLLLWLGWPNHLFDHDMQQPNGSLFEALADRFIKLLVIHVQAGSDGRAIEATAGRSKRDIDDIPPAIAGGEYDRFLLDQARQVPMPNGQAAQNAAHADLALLLALGSAVGLQRQLDSD